MKSRFTKLLPFLAILLAASQLQAHFPWLATAPDGKVLYFFGESLDDRTYSLPPSIAKAKVQFVGEDGKIHELKTETVESDEFCGFAI